MVNGRQTLFEKFLVVVTFGTYYGENHCPKCGSVVSGPFIKGKRGYVRCRCCGAEVYDGFIDRAFG